jgi:hypothetical protein
MWQEPLLVSTLGVPFFVNKDKFPGSVALILHVQSEVLHNMSRATIYHASMMATRRLLAPFTQKFYPVSSAILCM